MYCEFQGGDLHLVVEEGWPAGYVCQLAYCDWDCRQCHICIVLNCFFKCQVSVVQLLVTCAFLTLP